MKYKQYSFWGEKKLLIDKIEPTHYVRNFLIKKQIGFLTRKYRIRNACEVGCGLGILSKNMAEKGINVDAYDLDKQAIQIAKKYNSHRRITFSSANVFSIKNKRSYDLVLNIEVLEHINDDAGALKKMGELLHEKGLLLITVPANERYRTKFDDISGHARRYTAKELKEKLEKTGLRIMKVKYFGFPLLYYYYFHVYLKAAHNKEKLKSKGISPIQKAILKVMDLIFLSDLMWNTKKAINLMIIARKERR